MGRDIWPNLFQNRLFRTVALHQRLSGPRLIGEVRRITTDATPQAIGLAGWWNRAYIRVSAEETMAPLVEHDDREAGIADKELAGLAIGSVDGYVAHPNTVLFVRAGNMNAVGWAAKEKARSKCARMILMRYLFWCVKRGLDVVIFYLRTNRNVTAGAVTRLADGGPGRLGN